MVVVVPAPLVATAATEGRRMTPVHRASILVAVGVALVSPLLFQVGHGLIAVGLGAVVWTWVILTGPDSPRRKRKVDYDQMNRLEFELGIPFSSRPDEWQRPEVHATGGSYDVVCRDCPYRSTRHTTEVSAYQRAFEHYREHLTGRVTDE